MAAIRLSILLSFLSTTLAAQWLNYRTPGVPRERDGKPNLTAPAPRTAEGKPDLSGVWMHELTSAAEMTRLYGAPVEEAIKTEGLGMEIGTQHKYVVHILLDSDAAMLPGAAEIVRRRAAQANPADVCTGGSSIALPDPVSEPIKIVQSPRTTVILYEGFPPRQIYTDGRGWPKEFDLPAYVGYSLGHWEGDALIVETRGFNDKGVLDIIGHPQSEAMRVIERYHRRDFGHLDFGMTFDDPRMYTKPFTIRVPHNLLADGDIFESVCTDNEKDRAHLERK
jgi:hypothetical protein